MMCYKKYESLIEAIKSLTQELMRLKKIWRAASRIKNPTMNHICCNLSFLKNCIMLFSKFQPCFGFRHLFLSIESFPTLKMCFWRRRPFLLVCLVIGALMASNVVRFVGMTSNFLENESWRAEGEARRITTIGWNGEYWLISYRKLISNVPTEACLEKYDGKGVELV
ncbi:MAG: hypothetical protein DRN90_03895 [Thermoproteota archaeon]|nr:MAG: hypothetical protein DRN90_03895 [Candidatus Korarchaeota archaeon]